MYVQDVNRTTDIDFYSMIYQIRHDGFRSVVVEIDVCGQQPLVNRPNYSVGSTRDKNTCNLNKKKNRARIRQRSIYGTSFIGGLCHRIRNGLDSFTNVVLP